MNEIAMQFDGVPTGLSEEDRERRRSTIGSSDIASVLGVNPWSSPHQVWLAKVYGEEQIDNERTELGHLLEPVILGLYCRRYDAKIVRGGYTRGPEPWMAATPDGLVLESRGAVHDAPYPLCEAKLVGLRSLYMWGQGNTDDRESDEVPLHYLAQAQWQIIVTGAPYVDVTALLGTEVRSYRIRPNPTLQIRMIERAREFMMRYIIPREPPPVDGSDGARTMLRKLYPSSSTDPIPSDPDIDALVARLRAARAACDTSDAEKMLVENLLRASLKDSGGAFGDGWRIRYKTQRDGKRPFVFDDRDAKQGKAA